MFFGFVVAFTAAVIFALIFIPFMRSIKAGQPIKTIGPVWHMSKQGTPTMGGWIFIVGTVAGLVLYDYTGNSSAYITHIALFVFALVYAIIGFVDDAAKVRKRDNDGMSAGMKFVLQLAVALAFLFLMRYMGYLHPNVYVPFFEITVPFPEPLYFAFAAFVIVGTVNAVNITDGVDGVLTGTSLPVVACFAAVAYVWKSYEITAFAVALFAAMLGYLLFNFHPAKVFMGDTGSLFLGGAICAMAFALDVPLILVPLGVLYIVETFSDLIQIAQAKYLRKRFGLKWKDVPEKVKIFKMAPLHHHLEKCGWSEYKIFIVFTLISTLCAVIAFFGVFERYGRLEV